MVMNPSLDIGKPVPPPTGLKFGPEPIGRHWGIAGFGQEWKFLSAMPVRFPLGLHSNQEPSETVPYAQGR